MRTFNFLKVHPIKVAADFTCFVQTQCGKFAIPCTFDQETLLFELNAQGVEYVIDLNLCWKWALEGFNKQVASMIAKHPERRRYWCYSMNTVCIKSLTLVGDRIRIEYKWTDDAPQLEPREVEGFDGKTVVIPPHESWRSATGEHLLREMDWKSKAAGKIYLSPEFASTYSPEIHPFMFW